MSERRPKARVVERATLERVARVMGRGSGAAQAIAHADRQAEPQVFLDVGGTWLVVPASHVDDGRLNAVLGG
jgi:hypothetical protein